MLPLFASTQRDSLESSRFNFLNKVSIAMLLVEVIGTNGYLTLDLSSGYGSTWIAVAMLAALHPIGVVFAALFVAMVYIGVDSVGQTLGISAIWPRSSRRRERSDRIHRYSWHGSEGCRPPLQAPRGA